jgi:hypothetical protein
MLRKTHLNCLHTVAVTGLAQTTQNTITASGSSREFREMGLADAVRFYLDIPTVTGSSPKIVLTLAELDPATDTFFAANPASDPIFNATGFAATAGPLVSTIDPLYGVNYQIQWTVTGTTPSFTNMSLVAVLLHKK